MKLKNLTNHAFNMVRECFAEGGEMHGMACSLALAGKGNVYPIPSGIADADAAYMTRLWFRSVGTVSYVVYYKAIRGGAGDASEARSVIDFTKTAKGKAMTAWERTAFPRQVIMIVVCNGIGAGQQRLYALPIKDDALGDPMDMTDILESPFSNLLAPDDKPEAEASPTTIPIPSVR